MRGSPSPEEALREIRQDTRSGAAELAQKGAELLLDALKQARADEIRALGKALVDAQPTMAPMVFAAGTPMQSRSYQGDPAVQSGNKTP